MKTNVNEAAWLQKSKLWDSCSSAPAPMKLICGKEGDDSKKLKLGQENQLFASFGVWQRWPSHAIVHDMSNDGDDGEFFVLCGSGGESHYPSVWQNGSAWWLLVRDKGDQVSDAPAESRTQHYAMQQQKLWSNMANGFS